MDQEAAGRGHGEKLPLCSDNLHRADQPDHCNGEPDEWSNRADDAEEGARQNADSPEQVTQDIVEQPEQSLQSAEEIPKLTDIEGKEVDDAEATPFINGANVTEPSCDHLQAATAVSSSLASFRDMIYKPTTTPIANGTRSSNCCACSTSAFCKSMKSKCYNLCKPVMWKYHSRPGNGASKLDRIKYSFLCPPHGRVARMLVILLAIIMAFVLVWAVTGEEGVYGGNFFGLLVLFLMCVAAGKLMPFLRLPPLLGMLIMGCVLGNVPYIKVARFIDLEWSAAIRKVALAVILTRAGLGLDPKALKRMSCVVIRLAFLPCITEALVCMVTSHLILKLPLVWGLMLGFVLAAVSPAVVVPSLLSLSDKGYGVEQGIPTLVIAAASIDDVLAISSFFVLLSVAFSGTENIGLTVVKGPLEAVAGIVYGIVLGVILWYLPPHHKTNSLGLKRSALLLGGGLLVLFGSDAAGIAGAGALGCLTLPFVAALRWRKQLPEGETSLATEDHMGALWQLAQPFLFGLIGAAVDLTQINPSDIGWGMLILLIGLIFRLIASFLAVLGAGFTLKEKLFIPLAWLPKATVQALIGSLALDTANKNGGEMEKKWGLQILTIAVLCILLTAPLGAAAISLSGPRLLQKSSLPNQTNREYVDEKAESLSEIEMEVIEDTKQSV